jgi:hypothetical protein
MLWIFSVAYSKNCSGIAPDPVLHAAWLAQYTKSYSSTIARANSHFAPNFKDSKFPIPKRCQEVLKLGKLCYLSGSWGTSLILGSG